MKLLLQHKIKCYLLFDFLECCCCAPGHIKNMLSVNAMFSARWLAWQVVAAQYVIEGYSISDNSATTLLTVYEFRRALITYYVKSVIFFVVRSSKLDIWLKSEAIQEALQMTMDPSFVDLDPAFNQHLDEDFEPRMCGITRNSFSGVYLEWIKYCYEMRRKERSEKAGKARVDTETETVEGEDKIDDVSALVFEVRIHFVMVLESLHLNNRLFLGRRETISFFVFRPNTLG